MIEPVGRPVSPMSQSSQGLQQGLAESGHRSNVVPIDQRLIASLIGAPSMLFQGADLTTRLGKKPRALIYLLLLADSNRLRRSQIASMLWAGSAEAAARANLRLTLSRLRQQLSGLLRTDNDSVWIEPAVISRVDTNLVLSVAANAGQATLPRIRAALELYRGEFLEGFSVRDAPELDDWLRHHRELFRNRMLSLVQVALEHPETVNDTDARLWFSQRWVQIDETDEAANRQLMMLYQSMGRRSHAIRQYETYRQLLAERLGARPGAEIYELYRTIHANAPRDQPLIDNETGQSDDTTSSTTDVSIAGVGQLPRPSRPIVGRRDLLAAIKHRFDDPQCRLLTLLGPGGIGKTRLAIEFAQDFARDSGSGKSDSVVFVSLSGVPALADVDAASDALILAIAQSFGVSFNNTRDSNRKVLLRRLQDRKALLLLDSFEHLVAASPLLDAILEAASGIRILVTSRERPATSTQWLIDVPGLPVARDIAAGLIDASGSTADAFALFETVAQRVSPGFDLSDHLGPVGKILDIVHGSPLGIELAANWVRNLTCEEIVSRLEDGLDLLTLNPEMSNSRHGSMRAVLDSSWSMLDEAGQNGLAALSVFSASFNVEAAMQVTGLDELGLASLADRSWLTTIQLASGTRYLMHDLVRHFASEQLQADEATQVGARERHGLFFRAKLIKARSLLEGRDQISIHQLNPDSRNIAVAWRWLRENRQADDLVDFVESCRLFYINKGWTREAVSLLEQALEIQGLDKTYQVRWEGLLAQDLWHAGLLGRSRFHSEKILHLVGESVPASGVSSVLALSGSVIGSILGSILNFKRLKRDGLNRIVSTKTKKNTPRATVLTQALARLASIGYLAGIDSRLLIHYALRCNELSIAHAIPAGIVWSSSFLSILANGTGLKRVSAIYARRAYAALPGLGHSEFDAVAYLNFGIDRFIAAQWDTAIDLLDRGAACYETTGQWRVTMDTMAIRGLLHVTRRDRVAAHQCWSALRQQGSEHGDRLVELWGCIGAAETDLACGFAPDLDSLAASAQFLPAGTRHEQARFDACMAAGALLKSDFELAAHHAHKVLISLKPGRYLPFYDSEACYHGANVLLSLSERSPRQHSARGLAMSAANLAWKLARSNPFFMPRACQLMARAARHAGNTAAAEKYSAKAKLSAYKLGLSAQAGKEIEGSQASR
ncbi:MAG: BTAD domain-containing putative transcriptional regulator [Burkholderiaceae bacterium]